MESPKSVISRFAGKKVLVFGDLMLDEHIWSKVNRISPEAPVPIAEVVKITHVPGGCGNVAVNIASLGGIPILLGIIGNDSSGEKLLAALAKVNVHDKYLIRIRNRPTILKSRIIAGSQQVVRVDREDKNTLSPEIEKAIIKKLKQLIPQVDAVVISDYGKGIVNHATCQTIISCAGKHKIPVAVDPKGSNYSKYQHATIITPNLAEAGLAAGINITDERSLVNAGKKLLKQAKPLYILVTRGKDGMSLFDQQKVLHIPVVPREVFDITGAGDTVVAALALALAARSSIKTAAVLSNFAGSVVVGKVGTAPCTREELEEAIEGHEPITRKIKTRAEIAKIAKNLRGQGANIIFTNGCFDILHLGHARYLREAKKLGDVLIVGVNSDSSVRKLKGKDRPYVSEMERAEILASLECVDYVCIFNELTPHSLIKIIKPDVHVKGGDYKVDALPEKALVESLGGKVVVIPPTEGRSTTNIVKKILSKN